MKKIQRIGIVLIIVLGLLTGCGKSVEKQIAEQLELGNKYLTEADYEQAIVAFNKIIELDPKQAIAYEKLADSYIGLDEKEKAIDILRQGVSSVAEAAGQALKEEAVTLCEELLQTYLGTNTDEANRYYEQLKQLDGAKAAQYEDELQQAFTKEKIKAKYDESLKNAKAQIAGDAWKNLSVDQFSWKFELSQELQDAGVKDIVYDYEDGTYLQVTKSGYMYYGSMKDGKKNGENGIWLGLYNEYKYCFKGMWEDDYPNGTGEEWIIGDDRELITTGTWSGGLENGKMQMKYISNSWNEIVIFKYSVSDGMPEVIDYLDRRDGGKRCVVSYSTGEKDELSSWTYGYQDEAEIPWGINGWSWHKGSFINSVGGNQ